MSASRPSLLFLCQTLPFPPDGGVTVRTFNVLKQLAVRYDIHALCFFRRGIARGVDSAVAGLKQYAKDVEVFPIEQEFSVVRMMRDHLSSTATRTVYTRFAHENDRFRARLLTLLNEQTFDLVHVDSLDLSRCLEDLTDRPVVCVHHNVESLLLGRRALMEQRWWRRRYLQLQAGFMQQEEARWCPDVTLNVVCSIDDEIALQRIAPDAHIVVVPNGADTEEYTPADTLGDGVLFVGGMTWFPNKDALDFFDQSILPALSRRGPLPEIQWVGRALPGAAEHYAPRGIHLTGYVDDVKPYLAAARCFVVPLRVGGGTRLKILSAWAMGKPIVTTSIGCEGLDARDGWNAIIRDDPEDFAAAVTLVLEDDVLARRLGANARATVEEQYSWTGIGKRMRAVYEQIETSPEHTIARSR